MPLTNPALAFNFMVTMWDVQGPGLFGQSGGGWGTAATVASAVSSVASQLLLGAFSEISGLNAELDLESYNSGGQNVAAKKFVKNGRYPSLSFKRGITFNTDIWDWHQQVLHGRDAMIRKSGIILLLERASFANTSGQGFGGDLLAQLTRPPIGGWYFERGLPERLVGPQLEGRSNTVAIEQLDIAHEGLTRISLAMIPGLSDAAAGAGGLISAAAAGAIAAASAAGLAGARGDDDSKLKADPHYDASAPHPPAGGGG
jgi:phage tail-like protein